LFAALKLCILCVSLLSNMRTVAAVVVSGVAALILSGCGSDTTSTGAPAAAPAANSSIVLVNCGWCDGQGCHHDSQGHYNSHECTFCAQNGCPYDSIVATTANGCNSESSCAAEVNCHFRIGPMDCNLPNVKKACCDVFSMGMDCQSSADQQGCMQNTMMAFPPAELQWLQVHSNLQDSCPGLQQLNSGPGQFCTQGTTASDLLPGQVAIMTAQQYHPDNQKVGPIVPGVIGFAMGAAVVTSVVAMKKKRTSDLYSPLTEETA